MKTGAIVNEGPPATVRPSPDRRSPAADNSTVRVWHSPQKTRTQPWLAKPAGPEADSPALRDRNVTAQDLQGAVLFVLGLFASLAVLNLHAELAHLAQHWHQFVEFLANAIL